jgi:DNA-directed RNA polymerase specialized sigma24 family protein
VILREFTESLDETDRSIFLMYLDESFTYEDMAEVTGLKEPHIRVKVSRLKSLFRERYIGD